MGIKGKVSRRKFLGVSSSVAAGAVAGAAVIGGIAGFVGGQSAVPAREVTKTQTVTQPGAEVTKTVTQTVEKAAAVKAGYIYVGPVEDFGWTHAHDLGRKYADSKLKTPPSPFIESVPEAQALGSIEALIDQGANLIFTTSFGYMDQTAEAAAKHPDKYFVHISGFRSGAAGNAPENMSAAFAEFYQLYYLNGLAAGSVSQSGVIGYVAAFPIPEVVRHINAFVLGANYAYKKRTGKEIEAHVVWQFTWFDPGKTRVAAMSLVEEKNADVLGYTEDSPTTLQVAEEYISKKGRRVWSLAHYSDMTQYGPTAQLTGQVVNWGPIYEDFYRMVATGSWRSVDIWTRIGDYMPYRWRLPPERSTAGRPEGTVYLAPLNPAIPAEWQLEIKRRYEEMKELVFEPFSAEANLGQPIRDQNGETRIGLGERADHDILWGMDWHVEQVKTTLPKG